MWSGINFDTSPMISQATELINLFMPFIYIIGGIAIFGLVMIVVVAIARRAAG